MTHATTLSALGVHCGGEGTSLGTPTSERYLKSRNDSSHLEDWGLGASRGIFSEDKDGKGLPAQEEALGE